MIGLRWTAAGGGAGVDGVEKAADRFPLLLSGDGEEGLGVGASGIVGRDGGVSGAPNMASSVDGITGSGRGGGVAASEDGGTGGGDA